eukprot:TRINITY_DN20930_c0_g1_i1.p1 TRINITY_DN20930_c0_g1~~TRINITY_DN20930_c0_g1_i1.p1  ORF type:complete len:194 (-),score=45.59 TRINITY_DN20930_c0_g1_i1:222-803(-)
MALSRSLLTLAALLCVLTPAHSSLQAHEQDPDEESRLLQASEEASEEGPKEGSKADLKLIRRKFERLSPGFDATDKFYKKFRGLRNDQLEKHMQEYGWGNSELRKKYGLKIWFAKLRARTSLSEAQLRSWSRRRKYNKMKKLYAKMLKNPKLMQGKKKKMKRVSKFLKKKLFKTVKSILPKSVKKKLAGKKKK